MVKNVFDLLLLSSDKICHACLCDWKFAGEFLESPFCLVSERSVQRFFPKSVPKLPFLLVPEPLFLSVSEPPFLPVLEPKTVFNENPSLHIPRPWSIFLGSFIHIYGFSDTITCALLGILLHLTWITCLPLKWKFVIWYE